MPILRRNVVTDIFLAAGGMRTFTCYEEQWLFRFTQVGDDDNLWWGDVSWNFSGGYIVPVLGWFSSDDKFTNYDKNDNYCGDEDDEEAPRLIPGSPRLIAD